MRHTHSFIYITIILLCNKLTRCLTIKSNNNKGKSNGASEIKTCWMTLHARNLSENIDAIDKRYEDVRNAAQEFNREKGYSDIILTYFVMTGAVAERENFKKQAKGQIIPAGLNLGGYCMLRLNNSILFFNRMKLRNNTRFHVTSLKHDLKTMALKVDLLLNDLKLQGAFERTLTDIDPSLLMYVSTFGELEFLLKSVKYQIEAPYRLINNHVVIDSIRSEISVSSIVMTQIDIVKNKTLNVPVATLGAFIDRLKTDLDKWIMDCFNDIFMKLSFQTVPNINKLDEYDKEKTTQLEDWMDNAIQGMNHRIQSYGANNLKLPKFTINSLQDMQKIKLFNGILRGLDSMHRRSIPTSIKDNDTRKVDAIIGFSDLKVVYKYIVIFATGAPPMSGTITLSANELAGHLSLNLLSDPEALDLDIDFLDHMKPELLTVDGAGNRMIANFKHVLDQQITSIMINTLNYGVKLLRSLPNCDPFLPRDVLKKPLNFAPEVKDETTAKGLSVFFECGNKIKCKKPKPELQIFTEQSNEDPDDESHIDEGNSAKKPVRLCLGWFDKWSNFWFGPYNGNNKKKEEEDRKRREEEDRKKREEEDRKKREEEDRKRREEEDRKRREEEDRRKREEEDKRKREEEDRRKREEEDRRKREEEDRRKREEEDRKKKEKEDRRKREEEDRRKKEEEERKRKEEENKKKKQEEDRKKKEEVYNKKTEEENNKKTKEDYNKKTEEEYNKKTEEEYNKKTEVEYNKKTEEEYIKKKEEENSKKKEEDYSKKKEEEYNKKKEEENEKKTEEEYEKKKEDVYKKKTEEESGKKKEEEYVKKKKEEYGKKGDEEYSKKKEEEYGKKREEENGKKKEEEYGKKREEENGKKWEEEYVKKMEEENGKKREEEYNKKTEEENGKKKEEESGKKKEEEYRKKKEEESGKKREEEYGKKWES